MHVPLWVWFAVIGVLVARLAVDLLAHRRAHVIEVRGSAARSLLWLAFGVGFGVIVWSVHGAELGQQYFAGYLIESLAVDDVFVWPVVSVPTTLSLAVITTILTVSIVGSLRATRGQGRQELAPRVDPPFRLTTADELAAVEPLWRRRRPAHEEPRPPALL